MSETKALAAPVWRGLFLVHPRLGLTLSSQEQGAGLLPGIYFKRVRILSTSQRPPPGTCSVGQGFILSILGPHICPLGGAGPGAPCL